MVKVLLAVTIPTSTQRVWRALTDPTEIVAWDTGIVEPIDVLDDYPRPGQSVRWKYRLGPIPMVLYDNPLEVSCEERLRSKIKLGLFRFDETYTLHRVPERPQNTDLSVKLELWNVIPVVGSLLDHVIGRPIAEHIVASSLGAIKSWCIGS